MLYMVQDPALYSGLQICLCTELQSFKAYYIKCTMILHFTVVFKSVLLTLSSGEGSQKDEEAMQEDLISQEGILSTC